MKLPQNFLYRPGLKLMIFGTIWFLVFCATAFYSAVYDYRPQEIMHIQFTAFYARIFDAISCGFLFWIFLAGCRHTYEGLRYRRYLKITEEEIIFPPNFLANSGKLPFSHVGLVMERRSWLHGIHILTVYSKKRKKYGLASNFFQDMKKYEEVRDFLFERFPERSTRINAIM